MDSLSNKNNIIDLRDYKNKYINFIFFLIIKMKKRTMFFLLKKKENI